jgi:hypothetical protein
MVLLLQGAISFLLQKKGHKILHRALAGCSEDGNEPSGSLERICEFLEYELLKKVSVHGIS